MTKDILETEIQEKKDFLALHLKQNYPSVSFLLPVNKKYPHYKTEEQRMKAMMRNAEEKLSKELPAKAANSISEKLEKTIAKIDFSHLSQSLAVYVSPEVQKVIHLSFPVEEKMVIGHNFELRDLLYAAKNKFSYLAITLSEKKVRLFSGYNHYLEEIQSEEMALGKNDVGGKGRSRTQSFNSFASQKNISDSQRHNEKKIEKFLYDVDDELSKNFKQKNIPIILFGEKKTTEKFKNISKHEKIIGFVEGSFDISPPHVILEKTEPILNNELKTEQKKTLSLLEEAVNKRTFASGITEVWKAVMEKRGRILLVEKNYRCPARLGKNKFTLITLNSEENGSINYLPDAVDDIIEYVFLYGGDVAFVENGALSDHQRIALITYYP